MTTATMSPATLTATTTARPASFWNTLKSEWSKLATLRSTHLMLGLGYLLSLATTTLVVVAVGSTQTEWPDNLDPITISMIGTIFAGIVYTAFGVLAVSREYTNGTIRTTLIATPSRGRVFFAKLLLVGGIVLFFGLLTTLSMFFAGQAVLGAYGMPTATLSDPDAQRMVFGLGAAMPFFPVLGFAFGILTRSSAAANTMALGLLWLPQTFGAFVPEWFGKNILSLFPQSAMDSLTAGHLQDSPIYSDPAKAAVIVAVWLAAILGAAYLAFQQRDA